MKFVKSAAAVVALLVATSAQASAQGPTPGTSISLNGIGIGLVVIGAGLGIGRLAASAVESMARQPEIAAQIQTAMLISAAFIEGVAFAGIIFVTFFVK
jgi:F-type H+-transporting ATPase subunit c